MPDSVLGWTRDEHIDRVLDTLGRTGDATLRARMESDINFAQLAFWKLLDWKFAYKNGVEDSVSFTLATGTSTYVLNTASIGYEMRNTDIDKLYIIDPSYSRTLDKTTLRKIRSNDPGRVSTGAPIVYAGSKHNEVEVWPIPDSSVNGVEVFVDGKVLPTWLSTSNQYTSIPIEYQETFNQYFLYRTLSRERDPQQKEELIIFKDMLKTDIQYDLKEVESNLSIQLGDEPGNGDQYPGLENTLKAWNNSF